MGLQDMLAYARPRRGDLNGTVQLFFDNAGTILALIITLKGTFLSNDPEVITTVDDVIYQRVVPGLTFSIFIGGFFYAFQSLRLSAAENRKSTALPYGINTPGSYAVLYGVLLPVYYGNLNQCGSNPTQTFAQCQAAAVESAWSAGVVTNFLVGIISMVLGLFGPRIKDRPCCESLHDLLQRFLRAKGLPVDAP